MSFDASEVGSASWGAPRKKTWWRTAFWRLMCAIDELTITLELFVCGEYYSTNMVREQIKSGEIRVTDETELTEFSKIGGELTVYESKE